MLPKQRVPFFKRRFIQRLAVLSGGLAAGQAIILLVSPILTRLYTPSEFGVYALFTALNAIFINLVSLRYELAIPVARTDRDAAALACVALLAVSGLSLAGMPVVWLAGDWLAGFAGMPLMAQALWLLPPVVAVYSAGDVVSHWSIYRATFRLNAAGRVIQSGSQSVLQVGLGLLGYHGWGLLVGFVLGCFVRLGVLIWGTAPADRRLVARASSGEMAKLARANWQYPAFSTPASLLEASTQLLPLLFIAALFGPAFAGLYGLGQRLMGLPVRLFASAARNVFLGEAGQRQPKGSTACSSGRACCSLVWAWPAWRPSSWPGLRCSPSCSAKHGEPRARSPSCWCPSTSPGSWSRRSRRSSTSWGANAST